MSEYKLLNKEAALLRLGGDEELYQEVVSIFVEDIPNQLQALEQALGSQDVEASTRIAHSIKGASSNIGAEAMQAAALKAEAFAGGRGFAKSQRVLFFSLWGVSKNTQPFLSLVFRAGF